MGVELSDDLGEWVCDGVMLCQVVNKLHPGTIGIIHLPSQGQVGVAVSVAVSVAFYDLRG